MPPDEREPVPSDQPVAPDQPVTGGPSKRRGVPPPLDDTDRQVAAIAYLLTWITGLLVFVLADKDRRYARWHALQAIGVGIVAFVLTAILGVVQAVYGFVLGTGTTGSGGGLDFVAFPAPWVGTGLAGVANLLILLLVIVLAVKAYKDDTLRLPVLAGVADEHA